MSTEGVMLIILILLLGGLASLWYAVRPLPPKFDDLHRKVDGLPGDTSDNKPDACNLPMEIAKPPQRLSDND